MPDNIQENTIKNDFDGFWKEACDNFLKEFLHLAAPDIHNAIDWSKPYEALDTELQAILPKPDRSGKLFVDRLYRVALLDGKTAQLLLHIEVQIQNQAKIGRRMFDYNFCLENKLGQPVYSLLVLGDAQPNDGPLVYQRTLFDMKHRFEIPTVRLESFRDRIDELKNDDNPFALLLVAWFWTRDTRPDRQRLQFKIELMKLLRDRRYDRDQIRRVFHLLDWIVRLPEPLVLEFRHELARIEGENTMPFISPTEELFRKEGLQEGIQEGIEKGRQEGIQKGRLEGIQEGRRMDIERVLTARFGDLPTGLSERLAAIEDGETLETLVEQAALAGDLDQFMAGLPGVSEP